ncbi:transposase [Candidatus Woesearchaeota archaeon]|nr:transposase [Candidatus Woesearchaeota archaeon]
MEIIISKFKKVADFCYELCQIGKVPLYFSKYANKIYTNYQHLFMLVYKQARKFTYEELLTDLADNISLRCYLGLNELPHYTTLIKFAQRLPSLVIDKLVLAFKKLVEQPEKVAIDSTGISLDNASPHYCKRIGLPFKKRPFLKASFIVDINTFMILLARFRKKPRHDLIDAKIMVKKLSKHYKPKIFYADRCYDSDEMFKQVFEQLHAYPLILQKNLHIPKYKRHGTYRKKTYDVFDYGEYLQRNRIETSIDMFKKRNGHHIRSKNNKCQKVKAFTRVIAYNIDRLIRMGKNLILIIIKIRVSY